MVVVIILAKQFTNIWIRKFYQQYIFYSTDVFVDLSVFFQIMHFLHLYLEILLCPSKCLEKLGSLERIKLKKKEENCKEYT